MDEAVLPTGAQCERTRTNAEECESIIGEGSNRPRKNISFVVCLLAFRGLLGVRLYYMCVKGIQERQTCNRSLRQNGSATI